MCLSLYVVFTISVASDSPSDLVNGINNTFEYAVGVHFNLTCLVTPVPPPNSVFEWYCSDGCFGDMSVEKLEVVFERVQNREINCSVSINGINYYSKQFNLNTVGKPLSIDSLVDI